MINKTPSIYFGLVTGSTHIPRLNESLPRPNENRPRASQPLAEDEIAKREKALNEPVVIAKKGWFVAEKRHKTVTRREAMQLEKHGWFITS